MRGLTSSLPTTVSRIENEEEEEKGVKREQEQQHQQCVLFPRGTRSCATQTSSATWLCACAFQTACGSACLAWQGQGQGPEQARQHQRLQQLPGAVGAHATPGPPWKEEVEEKVKEVSYVMSAAVRKAAVSPK